jgi:hypothetical protein
VSGHNRHAWRTCCIGAVLLLLARATSADTGALTNSERAIEQALPSGWTIVERKTGEIPWGHHWCDTYKGDTGAQLIARGTNPSSARFRGSTGQWRDVVVGVEGLDIWIMPGSYRESLSDLFCFQRPPQPASVVELPSVRIYARPTHHSNADEKRVFDKELAEANAVESPESPWNDPARLSWRSWRADLRAAVSKHAGD